ncbi:MAG: glycosyltransferase family 4 protein [Acidimicrobiia bacterium]
MTAAENGHGRVRICAVIYWLERGGAERVLSTLCNEWAALEQDVTVVTVAAASHTEFGLSSAVARQSLTPTKAAGGLSRRTRPLRRLRQLRSTIQALNPDVVVSFGDRTNVMTLLALVNTSIPVVVSERTDPRRIPLTWIMERVRSVTYHRAAAIALQTQSVLPWAQQRFPTLRTRVIPNPVAPAQTHALSGARNPYITCVARFSQEKGVDVLIDAFARAGVRASGWRLHLVGDGPLRSQLEAQVRELGISDSVVFHGRVHDPEAYLVASQIAVLPSRVEGFPNALLEAMAAGTAVISTDCESGPSEIVTHGIDGLLVPTDDPDALATAIVTLTSDPELRKRLGHAGASVTTRFAPQAISEAWLSLFREVASTTAATRSRRPRPSHDSPERAARIDHSP